METTVESRFFDYKKRPVEEAVCPRCAESLLYIKDDRQLAANRWEQTCPGCKAKLDVIEEVSDGASLKGVITMKEPCRA